MSSDKVINTDILIIGGGMGGLFAAIKAKELGRQVTLVEKAYVGKSGVSLFTFAHIAVFKPEIHDLNRWMNFIVRVGEYVNNREWIELILKRSYERYRELVSWGVPFMDQALESTWHLAHNPETDELGIVDNAVAMTHKKWLARLRVKALESGVKVLDRVMMTELLKQNGKVTGAVGFHSVEGDFYLIKAKAVIIATGTGSFKAASEPMQQGTADGEAMSYRAGAEITSKEFGHKGVGFLKDFPTVPRGAAKAFSCKVYVNGEDEEFFERYLPGIHGMHLGALFEVHAGRGPIYFDHDRLTPEERKVAAEFNEVREVTHEMEKTGIDYRTHQGKVEMIYGGEVGGTGWGYGGVLVNTKCESTVPGLYAVGDSAGTRFSGSTYAPTGYGLGGAAGTGGVAAENASQYALETDEPVIDDKEMAALKEAVFRPLSRKGGFSPRYVTEILRNTMIPYFVVGVKHEKRLQAALMTVEFVREHLVPRLKANDAHELRLCHELRNMSLDAELILRASLFRTESRGTHYREDYPRRDDPNWLAWTVMKEEQGKMKVSKLPLPKEWWPDLSIPYEERYDFMYPEG